MAVREVYFYASWIEGRGPFDAHMMTQYNNKDNERVSIPDIDTARDIARQMRERSLVGAPFDRVETAYGMFFLEEFDDE